MNELISLDEARKAKILNLRKSIWANQADHISIYVTEDGFFGPWVKFYSPINEKVNGQNPLDLMITQFDINKKEWLPWYNQ